MFSFLKDVQISLDLGLGSLHLSQRISCGGYRSCLLTLLLSTMSTAGDLDVRLQKLSISFSLELASNVIP